MGSVRERFAAELATYEANKESWVKSGHDGEWIAIRSDRALGPFVLYAEAWKAGVLQLGSPGSFMVKRIRSAERPFVVSHIRWRTPAAE